jgi:hypothetical protein
MRPQPAISLDGHLHALSSGSFHAKPAASVNCVSVWLITNSDGLPDASRLSWLLRQGLRFVCVFINGGAKISPQGHTLPVCTSNLDPQSAHCAFDVRSRGDIEDLHPHETIRLSDHHYKLTNFFKRQAGFLVTPRPAGASTKKTR